MQLTESLFNIDKIDKKNKKSNSTIKFDTRKKSNIKPVAVIDIGTSKTCCMIANIDTDSKIISEIIGVSQQASKGIKNSKIIDLKLIEETVGSVIQSAENMARPHMGGDNLKNIFVTISSLNTIPHHFSVDINVSGRQISEKDIDSALLQARYVASPKEEGIVHIIPASYTVDRQSGIKTPVGMFGHQMTVDITTITADISSIQNLTHIINSNHLDIWGFCASSYAAGLSCLVEDEKILGCTVIDMGAGSTQIGVFFEGALIYTGAIPVGGAHVTNDIARGLTTSISDAERIKILYGSASATGYGDHETIDVTSIGEKDIDVSSKVSRSLLPTIILPRLEETFEMVRAKLNDEGLSQIAGRRVVLTGGASQLSGMKELAKHVLDKKVRLGSPMNIKGQAESTKTPAFAACIGSLQYAAKYADNLQNTGSNHKFSLISWPQISDNFLKKAVGWVKENW